MPNFINKRPPQPLRATSKPTMPRWLALTAFISVAVLVVGGIILAVVLVHLSHSAKQLPDGTDIIQEIQQYPPAYTDANLPQYPGATITQFGDSNATPKDHIVVYASTNDSVAKTATYYDQAMQKLGWVAAPIVNPDSDSTIRTYQKGDQKYTATIIRDQNNNRTNILITWIEASN